MSEKSVLHSHSECKKPETSQMVRSKKEDAAWESHRRELKDMYLDQGLTAEQIQQHMSQQYNFSKRYAYISIREHLKS
jgi:hypothetical protein